MDANTSDVPDARLSQEILALYREARAGLDTDFKHTAMDRARALLLLSASTWVNGVLGEHGPVLLEASSIDLKPGFWQAMEPFMTSGEDPLGPLMYAAPGRSFVTTPEFFPPAMQMRAHEAFDVHGAVTGLSLDPHTGIFSAVCWHRNSRLPQFTEAERRLHEQLLPHWMEGLALHRVLRAVRSADLAWTPGNTFAVVDLAGLIHHAQAGFGELLKEEVPDWRGAALPTAIIEALSRKGRFEGEVVRAAWRATPGDQWVVEASHRHVATTTAIARGLRSSVLDASLFETQQQLGMVSGALAEQQRQQAVVDERHRIMRDLHDGVGSHLVGLLNLAHRGTLDAATMEEALREALDEMRMAVDSMQAGNLDVVTALANLRYRLQPRFNAASIRTHWDLPADDDVPAMVPSDVFQWQRILLEAVTNVLKHSRAANTHVIARVLTRDGCTGIDVTVADDGVGMGTGMGSDQGHGTRNMRHRARAIGAQLAFEPGQPSGTSVRLWWPERPLSVQQQPPAAAPLQESGIVIDSDFGRCA